MDADKLEVCCYVRDTLGMTQGEVCEGWWVCLGGRWVGGSYFCPRHLLHFSPRREEMQTGREKGKAEKRAVFQRLSLPEITHLRPTMCMWVWMSERMCFYPHKRIKNMCMFMRVWFQPIDLCLPEIKLMSCVYLVLRSLIFWFPLFS